MPSPAAEAHQKEMQKKFAPAKDAMLKNATPSSLYTHHVMGVYTQYDLLGRVNAVSNNHRNARPIMSRLTDHALQAMKACVQAEAEEAKRTGQPAPEIPDHHGIALLLDSVSEAVADGDYVKATENLERFMATALSLTITHAKGLSHATHGAVAGELAHTAAILQDHYYYPEKYVSSTDMLEKLSGQDVSVPLELLACSNTAAADTTVSGEDLDKVLSAFRAAEKVVTDSRGARGAFALCNAATAVRDLLSGKTGEAK